MQGENTGRPRNFDGEKIAVPFTAKLGRFEKERLIMKSSWICLSVVLLAVAVSAAPLMTPWGEKVTSENCWREYPRPQMVRENWTCLNGDWDYAVTSATNTPGRPTKWQGKIRVPFAPESALSGVGRLIEPDEFLWYTRKINCTRIPGERILLHFDGVDFRAMVFIGHREVTDVPHEGAQEPFTLDITDYVKSGENELTVCCWDPTGRYNGFLNSRGKQSLKPEGCFYTRVSGIWQTVWMETVPADYIADYKVVTDIDAGTVKLEFEGGVGERMVTVLKAGEKTPLSNSNSKLQLSCDLPRDFECWSPENPKLYPFIAKYGKDEIKGYFGMRKIEKRKDAKGFLRFFLNNKPYYILGTLDQGWWPDGLLTPPSDEAMAFDIQTLKDCGFNTMRKHIKVEPRRYYHLCDTLGILVLQDLPCASSDMHGPMKMENVFNYGFQRLELKRMMDGLQSVPSIVMWIPFNEGWSQPGEFLTHSTLDFTKRYDPTRLVGGPSGAWDFEGGHILPRGWKWAERVMTSHKPATECEAADTIDMHLYRQDNPDGIHAPHRIFAVNDRRISFLGEFGGLGHPVEGHLWKPAAGGWGYGGVEDTRTREGLQKAYLAMMDDLADLAGKGLGGSIYTQTTDVEIEINGLMTYDRKVLKFDPAVLKRAHEKIIAQICEQGDN
jgi:hypothetical protein